MSKNPSNVPFTQPKTPMTGNSTAKQKGNLGFKQPSQAAGKNSSKANPTNVPFKQQSHGQGGKSVAKNSSKVPFKGGGPKSSLSASKTQNVAPKAGKANAGKNVAPKIKSIDDMVSYRKKKYGV